MQSEQEHLKQSQKIINAAFKCISTKGYASVSLRNIADEAGVVLSQLNYYYKNKDGLFSEVIRLLLQKYLEDIEIELEKGVTAKEKVALLIMYFKTAATKQPELFKLLFDFTDMALWSATFSELLRGLFKDLTNLIEKHIFADLSSNEKLRGYSPTALSRMLFGAIYGSAIQVILDPDAAADFNSLNALQAIFE